MNKKEKIKRLFILIPAAILSVLLFLIVRYLDKGYINENEIIGAVAGFFISCVIVFVVLWKIDRN